MGGPAGIGSTASNPPAVKPCRASRRMDPRTQGRLSKLATASAMRWLRRKFVGS